MNSADEGQRHGRTFTTSGKTGRDAKDEEDWKGT